MGDRISRAHAENAKRRKIDEEALRLVGAGNMQPWGNIGVDHFDFNNEEYRDHLDFNNEEYQFGEFMYDDVPQTLEQERSEDESSSLSGSDEEPVPETVIVPVSRQLLDNTDNWVYNNILDWIVRERNRLHSSIPTDSNEPLYKNSFMSKRTFADGFDAIVRAQRIKPLAQAQLLAFMQKAFPDADIPMHTSSAHNTISDVASYVPPSVRLLTVDICPRGNCCAFFGNLKAEIMCSCCFADRFTRCTNRKCKHLPYERCEHDFSTRVALKTMHYRPLLGLIIELLETDGFLSCLQWTINEPRQNKSSDIMHGRNVRKHLTAMHDNFSASNRTDSEVTEVNLLLSLFYDGAQVLTFICITSSKFFFLTLQNFSTRFTRRPVLTSGLCSVQF